MKYLLDTQILLWHFGENKKLSETAKAKIFEPTEQCFVSVVSLWEVAIKMNINRLSFDGGFSAFRQLVEDNGFDILPIKNQHLESLFDLPLIHRDPFDRLIVSTAISENMTIVTADEDIQKYDVQWVF
ncbi:MAG: type II toxin-antitoxin system VapC family toxin [Oscillospiraceae bacterium]|nr:type II toxin-antitoxin system VapC family toxin [Oscillospiraceae bacterium]